MIVSGNSAISAEISRHWSPVQIHAGHHRVIAIFVVVQEQLLTEVPFRRGEPVVEAVELREAETPIEMVCLHGVRKTVDVERGLVQLDGVRLNIVGRGRFAIMLV